MRNQIQEQRKLIAFSLAILLIFIQFSPLSEQNVFSNAAKAATGQEEGDVAGVPTGPSVFTPDRVDLIPATGGAAFISDTFVTVNGLEATERTTNSIHLSWDAIDPLMENVSGYYIYMYDTESKKYVYLDTVADTKYVVSDLPIGQEFYFTISAYDEKNLQQTHFCTPLQTYTRPEQPGELSVKTYTKSSITVQWTKVESATGYVIYRATEKGEFTKVGSSTGLEYEDTGLSLGTTYRYMIRTYAVSENNTSAEDSNIIFMTTKAKKPTISGAKGGTNRIRIRWKKVAGANGYTIRRYDGKKYQIIANLAGVDTLQFLQTGLTNNVKYQYKVCAYRTVNGVNYDGLQSDAITVTPVKVAQTSKSALLYRTKKAFKKSSAYKTCTFFKKKVNYAKSIIIPGLQNTNVAGFGSSTMVPQGMTFAKSYLLVAAYDKKGEENSVIYVINKSTKKLVTTVVLPSRLHAGGLAFDGTNIWITHTTNLYSIKYSKIKSAISKKASYVEIPAYSSIVAAGQNAGSLYYYKNLLWVGSYNETSSGYLGSYQIVNKTAAAPSLLLKRRIKIANRVQGFAFTSNGYLVLSRSCQTDKSKRGFLHQLDVYKPNVKKASQGIVKPGRIRKRVDMPSMNEEIAISGKYLYVNYESGAFTNAVNRTDRICAFKVNAVVKK